MKYQVILKRYFNLRNLLGRALAMESVFDYELCPFQVPRGKSSFSV